MGGMFFKRQGTDDYILTSTQLLGDKIELLRYFGE